MGVGVAPYPPQHSPTRRQLLYIQLQIITFRKAALIVIPLIRLTVWKISPHFPAFLIVLASQSPAQIQNFKPECMSLIHNCLNKINTENTLLKILVNFFVYFALMRIVLII